VSQQQPRVALVLGAGDYIGAAIARRFAAGGSPNAYLAHLVIPAIEQRTGARFRFVAE
jgi:NAD(P)-dependent dehydrogenase (short-subunit alcohol dehydrogenase family)